MKKAKEDAMLTRQSILDAAFKCFFENGFNKTTLDMIAREASVTRGAVYWHFKDKSEIYREVVKNTLYENDVVQFAHSLSAELRYEEKLYEIFWYAQNENNKIVFIYKVLNFVSQAEEFADLKEAIQMEKIKLFRYFTEETRMHIQKNGLVCSDAEEYGSVLFLFFEGMFLMKNISVGLKKDRAHIEKYIRIIVNDLIDAPQYDIEAAVSSVMAAAKM